MKFLQRFAQFLNESKGWTGYKFFYAVLEDEAHYLFAAMRLYTPGKFINNYPQPANPDNFDFSRLEKFSFTEDCLGFF
jgi:hypothetical protein